MAKNHKLTKEYWVFLRYFMMVYNISFKTVAEELAAKYNIKHHGSLHVHNQLRSFYQSLHENPARFFDAAIWWDNTPQGFAYWKGINHKFEKNYALHYPNFKFIK